MLYKKVADNFSEIRTEIENIEVNSIPKQKDNYQSFSTKHSTRPKLDLFSRNGALELSKNSVATESRTKIQLTNKLQETAVGKGFPKALNIGRNDLMRLKLGLGINKTIQQKDTKRNITPKRKFK